MDAYNKCPPCEHNRKAPGGYFETNQYQINLKVIEYVVFGNRRSFSTCRVGCCKQFVAMKYSISEHIYTDNLYILFLLFNRNFFYWRRNSINLIILCSCIFFIIVRPSVIAPVIIGIEGMSIIWSQIPTLV